MHHIIRVTGNIMHIFVLYIFIHIMIIKLLHQIKQRSTYIQLITQHITLVCIDIKCEIRGVCLGRFRASGVSGNDIVHFNNNIIPCINRRGLRINLKPFCQQLINCTTVI
eukprot:93844_1